MPRIPWNPRNYSYGAGSNLGPAALNTLRDGKGYVGSDGLVHSYKDEQEKKVVKSKNTFNCI